MGSSYVEPHDDERRLTDVRRALDKLRQEASHVEQMAWQHAKHADIEPTERALSDASGRAADIAHAAEHAAAELSVALGRHEDAA